MQNEAQPRKISVIGAGYLGATHAACMAELGFEVVGVDVEPERVERLNAGILPFHEPGLDEMLESHVRDGRLRFTTDYQEVADADVHFIGVGTPQRENDHGADMRYVDAAIDSLGAVVSKDTLIAGKSTVPVGTAARLAKRLKKLVAKRGVDINAELCWNPEFLREGFAVEDTLTPDRLVFGVQSKRAEDILRAVYAKPLADGTPLVVTDFETAELVKVAANAFLATKISFINAFSEVTETAGGDIKTLADAIGMDPRIGRKFLNAGIGFGGGCLPKDIRALQARVSELGLPHTMRFLDHMDEINLRRRERAIYLAERAVGGDLHVARVTVLGAAFKPNSDDVRDSPALDVAARLYSSGADVSVYDPQGMKNAAKRFPRLRYAESAEDAARGANVVLLLTEWDEFKNLDPVEFGEVVADRYMIDGRNVLDPRAWTSAGWTLDRMGHKGPERN